MESRPDSVVKQFRTRKRGLEIVVQLRSIHIVYVRSNQSHAGTREPHNSIDPRTGRSPLAVLHGLAMRFDAADTRSESKSEHFIRTIPSFLSAPVALMSGNSDRIFGMLKRVRREDPRSGVPCKLLRSRLPRTLLVLRQF